MIGLGCLLAQQETRVVYGFNPILPLFETWQIAGFSLLFVFLVVISLWLVRRDTVDVPKSLRVLLITLRLAIFSAILLFVFELQKSTETRVLKRSRLPILVDTSLSMAIEETHGDQTRRRIEAVLDLFRNENFWRPLAVNHDLEVYRFDENSQPELIAASVQSANSREPATMNVLPSVLPIDIARSAWFAAGFLLLSCGGILLVGLSVLTRWRGRPANASFAVGWLAICSSIVFLAVCDLATTNWSWNDSLASLWKAPVGNTQNLFPIPLAERNLDEVIQHMTQINWEEKLTPRGTATRLGDCVQYLINRERGGSIAGVLVVSDGVSNAGTELTRAAALAQTANVPLFPVGIGDNLTPTNVEIASWQLPAKAFPGDRFVAKALVQHSGFGGALVRLQVVSTDDAEKEPEVIEDEQEIVLSDDGKATPVDFELRRDSVGSRRYKVRIAKLPNELDGNDNVRSTLVEIVDKKTVVLLIAGGPHRDFQFLRNQLFRDPTIELQVYLQSAKEGADQEGHKILKDFPATLEELDSIDCIVAFDPDWSALQPVQAEILEEWIANKAGGLIVTAGPVNTPVWTRLPPRHPVISLIRRVYPVVFYNQSSAVLSLGRFGGEKPYPLEFTREGRESEFLWLGSNADDNDRAWKQLEGVFGYYAVNEAKPGAEVLAHFSDPKTAVDDRLPIYLASQYYGSGRVLFQASNEAWRMRRKNVDYFQSYYDKLIRWASQGRLNRNSKNGTLLTDKQSYWVGDQISAQAILQVQDPNASLPPTVTLDAVLPNGDLLSVELKNDANAPRPGTYSGSVPASREGDYRLRLTIPYQAGEMLTQQVNVRMPDLEKQRPERNDRGLAELAEKSNGQYFVGLEKMLVASGDPESLSRVFGPHDQESVLPGAVDKIFRRKLMTWLMIFLTFVLASQWTIRRLNKLA